MTPISYVLTPVIPIINLLANDPPSRGRQDLPKNGGHIILRIP